MRTFCPCTRVCMCIYACVCMRAQAHVRPAHNPQPQVSLIKIYLHSETGSPTDKQAGCQRAQGTTCLCLPSTGTTADTTTPRLFLHNSRHRPQGLKPDKQVTNCTISPVNLSDNFLISFLVPRWWERRCGVTWVSSP